MTNRLRIVLHKLAGGSAEALVGASRRFQEGPAVPANYTKVHTAPNGTQVYSDPSTGGLHSPAPTQQEIASVNNRRVSQMSPEQLGRLPLAARRRYRQQGVAPRITQ